MRVPTRWYAACYSTLKRREPYQKWIKEAVPTAQQFSLAEPTRTPLTKGVLTIGGTQY